MHWFESSVYFSAAPLASVLLPLHSFRIFTLGLILFPLNGHVGHGSWDREPEYNHYIHHSKFNWNYGFSPLWDFIMGTNYPYHGRKKNSKREQQAMEQASMVQCQMGKDFKDYAHQKSK